MSGLEPRGFVWVIANRLAVSERIGGHGFQHRRVRRTEEIVWIRRAGVNAVLSLLVGNHNRAAYESAGLAVFNAPLGTEIESEDVDRFFAAIDEALGDPRTVLLVHRDIIDDTVAGLLAGFLVHSGLVKNPIVATSLIQEIVGRPIGPEGRRLIPHPA